MNLLIEKENIMNQQQKNYTMKRLDQILERKIEPLQDKYTTQPVELSTEEKWTMVIAGTAVTHEDPRISGYNPDLDEIFDFSMHEVEHCIDEDGLRAETENLQRHCQKLKDEIMLGSADEAISKITEFEAL